MQVTTSVAIMQTLRLYCNYADGTFCYSYVRGSFCCNHACNCFFCNYSVRSFCSTYVSGSFIIEYVGHNFYCIYADGSHCCNYASGTFCSAQLFLLQNASYCFCYSYVGDTFKKQFYIAFSN